MRDLLPRIPEKCTEEIINRGWTSSDRIGSTGKLTLETKVRLAALAYIRHNFTDYRTRLRKKGIEHKGRKKAARKECLDQTVRMWIQWGGQQEILNHNRPSANKRRKVCPGPGDSDSNGTAIAVTKTVEVIDLVSSESDDEQLPPSRKRKRPTTIPVPPPDSLQPPFSAPAPRRSLRLPRVSYVNQRDTDDDDADSVMEHYPDEDLDSDWDPDKSYPETGETGTGRSHRGRGWGDNEDDEDADEEE